MLEQNYRYKMMYSPDYKGMTTEQVGSLLQHGAGLRSAHSCSMGQACAVHTSVPVTVEDGIGSSQAPASACSIGHVCLCNQVLIHLCQLHALGREACCSSGRVP